MQIIILGMHRSGTSMLARLTNLMGVYFGADGDSIGSNDENPNGFWERRDSRKINDALLFSVNCDWDKVSQLDQVEFPPEALSQFADSAAELIEKMPQEDNWLLKEPRMCLLLDHWKAVLGSPLFVHIYRNPMEVASSLNVRNGIPYHAGVSLWEKYNVEAINGSSGLPRIFVSYEEIMRDPVTAIVGLYQQLIEHGVKNISCPSEEDIHRFVDKKLHRQRSETSFDEYLNKHQLALYDVMQAQLESGQESQLSCSQWAKRSLSDYEVSRTVIEQLEREKLELELECGNLNDLASQLVTEIDGITSTNRWRIGDSIVAARNRLIGRSGEQPAFIQRVVEIDRSLRLYSTKRTGSSGED